ncbi:MAG: glycine--tRNA ligase subunit beta [Elusimicrobia bacterium]|nr:glycine--tRNA ligase subunit beta [Elusimicrobiota bacterium]
MVKDALIELGTEELPAGYIAPALAQMKESTAAFLAVHGISYGAINAYATPRRLALEIQKLSEKSDDRVEEYLGPSASVWRDAQGNCTMAAKGFAAKHGLDVDSLTAKTTPRGEYLCIAKKIPGRKTEKILAEILPQVAGKITFPKTMVWNDTGFRFARPARTLMVLYGNKTIRCSVAGLKAGNVTSGLHTTSAKKITISAPDKYVTVLRNNCVIADPVERREVLKKVIDAAAKRAKGTAIDDDGLVDEVNYLIEHPVAVAGEFAEKFLQLPAVVLINCLKKKQKFFAVTDAAGRLTNSFIGIRNGISEYQEVVREGYQRVLTARLSDAEFFYNQDTKTSLAAKTEKLSGIMFQKKLGTLQDKIQRVRPLALALNEMLQLGISSPKMIERAVELCKADLVTVLVVEYPELQGIIGSIYAVHDKELPDVAVAIEQHYWPLTADGKLPENSVARVVSLADKLDTLVGDFAAGLIPSGSADPYGLRRISAGIMRMLEGIDAPVSIRQVVGAAYELLPASIKTDPAVVDKVVDFMRQRWENILQSRGNSFDSVRAVLAAGFDTAGDSAARLEALKQIRELPDFTPLAAAFKRASNILKQADKQKMSVAGIVEAALITEESEKALFAAVTAMQSDVQTLITRRDYRGALQRMVSLKPVLDIFFEKVMVMAEAPAVRANRLALLKFTTGIFAAIADFSQLQ